VGTSETLKAGWYNQLIGCTAYSGLPTSPTVEEEEEEEEEKEEEKEEEEK
jgi:hypothetical protein